MTRNSFTMMSGWLGAACRGAVLGRSIAWLALVALALGLTACAPSAPPSAGAAAGTPATVAQRPAERGERTAPPAPQLRVRSGVGFRTLALLDQHYAKHGREFGDVSREGYLRIAQSLRDAPGGDSVLEKVRGDGVTTRFDRRTGTFLAFNPDRTIRTCFKPRDGERYFKRQALRNEAWR